MNNIIEARGLTKSYGSSRGIVDLQFAIPEGEVFGFLGPNGAGKTTTLRVLMGFLRATSGTVTIAGLDCWQQSTEIKHFVGYLPGEFSFDPSLTGAEIITYLGNLRRNIDQAYVSKLVERFGLDLSKRFRQYSRGNKQKVGLVQAFMHSPRLLILDEPTSGLDPLNQQEFYTLIDEVRATGQTVFFSSHILPEVERICDHVGIIREGMLIRVGEVASLKNLQHHKVELFFATPANPAWFSALLGVLAATQGKSANDIILTVQGSLQAVIQLAAQHGVVNIATHETTLEEVFLTYYKPELLSTTHTALEQ